MLENQPPTPAHASTAAAKLLAGASPSGVPCAPVRDLVGPTDEIEPARVKMSTSINGVEVSHGAGSACLGDPVEALGWLARTVRKLDAPLRAGRGTASLSGFGAVTACFGTGGAA